MKTPFDLTGKKFFITGASSGIGSQTAITLASLGAQVIINGRDELRLNETLEKMVGNHQMIVGDISKMETIDSIVEDCGIIDGIVHSAGVLKRLPFKFSNYNDLHNIMLVNFEMPFILTQRLVKEKKILKNGSIVFVSSISGVSMIAPGISMYSASKGAINASVRVMALELSGQKIRVNSVAPGMVNTKMNLENLSLSEEDLAKDEKNKYPLGYGEPEDVANCIAFLLSDASKWITGTTIILDGGASLI